KLFAAEAAELASSKIALLVGSEKRESSCFSHASCTLDSPRIRSDDASPARLHEVSPTEHGALRNVSGVNHSHALKLSYDDWRVGIENRHRLKFHGVHQLGVHPRAERRTSIGPSAGEIGSKQLR